MAYGTRPYGKWAYGFSAYSTWHMVDAAAHLQGVSVAAGLLSNPTTHLLEATLGGQSSVAARLNLDGVVHVGALTGQSGIYPNLRLYWEDELPTDCGDEWTPGAPCDAVWTPAAAPSIAWATPAACTVTWGGQAGCDVPWTPLPAPPFLCPELEAVDG